MTPYYEHGGITIYHGDCREILPQLGKFDAAITDPPYGMNKAFPNDAPGIADDLALEVIHSCRAVVSGNLLAFWSAQRMDVINQFRPKRIMIWNKTWAIYTPHNVGYRFEPIMWISGDSARNKIGDIFEAFPIIRRVQDENVGHPTQKPLELMTQLVENFTDAGSTVLDPFMGSGTTILAAKNLGRIATGIEIEERYCEIAAKRLSQEVLTFDEVPA